MKILIVGRGGREHALAWKLAKSLRVSQIWVAPGNGGTLNNIPIVENDFLSLIDFVRQEQIDLTIIGPEGPLAAGIVDAFQRVGLNCFGPTQAAAQIESSKVFAKDFMRRHHIPTGRYGIFTIYKDAIDYLHQIDYKVVIKASGLAAGKGVMIPDNTEEAKIALQQIMVDRTFGAAGNQVLIEERLYGLEVSIMAFCDGRFAIPMIPAQDYKGIYAGGPNTGGMGAYAPVPFVTGNLLVEIMQTIIQPAIDGLRQEEMPFVGILFAGLMLTTTGFKVLEFNCRFGDPEAQVVLPLLGNDLANIFEAALKGDLSQKAVYWRPGVTATVIATAKGYPLTYPEGYPITGISKAETLPETTIFHAGTKRSANGDLVTAGGRVLGVTAIGNDLDQALERAYKGIGCINFEGIYFRNDIGVNAS